MLNMNSPTVQAMLNNLPQGVGNMSGAALITLFLCAGGGMLGGMLS